MSDLINKFRQGARYLFYFPPLPVAVIQVRLHAKIVYWKPRPPMGLLEEEKKFPHISCCACFRVLFYFLFLLLHFTLSLIYVSATRKHKIGVFFIWIFYSTVFSVPLNCFPAKWITQLYCMFIFKTKEFFFKKIPAIINIGILVLTR